MRRDGDSVHTLVQGSRKANNDLEIGIETNTTLCYALLCYATDCLLLFQN